jgi:hypothetical protein
MFDCWYYLEHKRGRAPDRAVYHDFINLPSLAQQQRDGVRWFELMDETRNRMGTNTPWGSKGLRSYNHYIISPDPRDAINIETLSLLATNFALEFARGCEVAIIYHDDNAGHILHAHVVVNNYDYIRNGRWHIDRATPKRMQDHLQETAKELGLRYFDNLLSDHESSLHEKTKRSGFSAISLEKDAVDRGRDTAVSNDAKPYTDPERIEVSEQGICHAKNYSWKADIRTRVECAYQFAHSTESYLEACRMLGITVTRSAKGDFKYALQERPTRCINGNTLGANHTFSGITKRYAFDASVGNTHDILDMRERTRLIKRVKTLAPYPLKVTRAGSMPYGSGVTLREFAEALSVANRFSLRSLHDIDVLAATFKTDDGHFQMLLARTRHIAEVTGMLPVTSTSAQAPRVPRDMAALLAAEFARLMKETYVSLGYLSGAEQSLGGAALTGARTDGIQRSSGGRARQNDRRLNR